jgi:hypothetical protein
MISHLNYPRSLIKVDGKPWMIVECKASSIKLTEQVIRQAAMYNAKLSAKYLTVSNGLSHMTCNISGSEITILDSLPAFEEI